MTSDDNTLGNTIRSAREAKGMSRELLAGTAGVSLRTIIRLEDGENVPRPATLRVIEMALGLDGEPSHGAAA